MTNLIARNNGEPFATEFDAKLERIELGLTDTHDVIQHGGGWVLREKQSGAEPETTTEPTTEQQPMPQQHLADQLEAALSALEQSQSEVDRLQSEYRAAYPKIHAEVVPSEDMIDPANWRAGDVIKAIRDGVDITRGWEYTITGFDSEEDPVIVDDSGDEEPRYPDNFRFIRRP